MIRTGIDVTRFGRVARGAGGAAPVEVPECAGPGRAVGVSNGKRQVGRAWGQAENNCRAGGDAGARRGRRRGGWTESEGVGGWVSARGWGSNWRTCGWGWWGVERWAGAGFGGSGVWTGPGRSGRAWQVWTGLGGVVPTRAAGGRPDGGALALVRCSPWSAGRYGGRPAVRDGWWAPGRRLARAGPVFAPVGGSVWGPATLSSDAGFRTS